MDQLVEALADGPGGGEAAGESRLPGSGDELGPRLDLAVDGDVALAMEILEGGEIGGGGDAIALEGTLVLLGQVRQEGEVVGLGAALHAELVVEAAVALGGEVEGDLGEGGGDDAAGGGAIAGDEVAHRAAVGLGIGDELEEAVLDAEEIHRLGALQLPAGSRHSAVAGGVSSVGPR